jgi:hypothetical protein
MTDVRTLTWVIPNGSSVSNGIRAEDVALYGLTAPIMTTNTAYLYLEASDDPDSVADASATWLPVYDEAGTRISFAVSTSESRRIAMDTALDRLGRVRVKAVTSAGGAVNQSGAKTITPRFRG